MSAAADAEFDPGEARPDAVLDAVGLFCPVPIIRTAEAMKKMRPDGVLEVLSDDRVILIDMPAWCRSTGNTYLGSFRDGPEYHLFVRKGGGRRETPPPPGGRREQSR
ncbi:MAG: sulfurtransferase TusA family protein [Acidobacteriota bacterium]